MSKELGPGPVASRASASSCSLFSHPVPGLLLLQTCPPELLPELFLFKRPPWPSVNDSLNAVICVDFLSARSVADPGKVTGFL